MCANNIAENRGAQTKYAGGGMRVSIGIGIIIIIVVGVVRGCRSLNSVRQRKPVGRQSVLTSKHRRGHKKGTQVVHHHTTARHSTPAPLANAIPVHFPTPVLWKLSIAMKGIHAARIAKIRSFSGYPVQARQLSHTCQNR